MEDATFIKLLEKQEASLKEFIQTTHSLNRAKMINVIDPIVEDVAYIKQQNEVRNERIEKLEDNKAEKEDLEKVKKETVISRWMHRNPRVAIVSLILVALIFGIGSAYTYHRIDVKRTIEKILPVVLDEVQPDP